LSYEDLPVNPFAFRPTKNEQTNFLFLIGITAVVLYVLVNTFFSEQPFEEKILTFILGCGFIALTSAVVVLLSRQEEREFQTHLHEGTL